RVSVVIEQDFRDSPAVVPRGTGGGDRPAARGVGGPGGPVTRCRHCDEPARSRPRRDVHRHQARRPDSWYAVVLALYFLLAPIVLHVLWDMMALFVIPR